MIELLQVCEAHPDLLDDRGRVMTIADELGQKLSDGNGKVVMAAAETLAKVLAEMKVLLWLPLLLSLPLSLTTPCLPLSGSCEPCCSTACDPFVSSSVGESSTYTQDCGGGDGQPLHPRLPCCLSHTTLDPGEARKQQGEAHHADSPYQ